MDDNLMNNINDNAFGFVDCLALFEGEFPSQKQNNNLKGDGQEMIADLGEISDFTSNQFNPINGETVTRYKTVNGNLVGLTEEYFSKFSTFLQEILDVPAIKSKCDFDFIIKHSLEWLIDIYKNKRATCNLLTYLLNKITEETREYNYYYRLQGLSIENDFQIGNAEVVFISGKMIDSICEQLTLNEVDKLEVRQKCESLGGINIKITISSTKEYASKIALKEAELAVDVLKCFLSGYSLQQFHAIPDLRHKHQVGNLSYWVSGSRFSNLSQNFKNETGFIALPLDNKFIIDANRRGLSLLSDFIKNKSDDDLYLEIVNSIQRFATVVSTRNSYEKVAKCISILEGCILGTSHKKKEGETCIKNHILPKLTNIEVELFQKIIRKSYDVRNKFVHNNYEIPIDENELWVLLEIIRLFVIRLVELHNSGKREFEDIADYFINNS